MDTQQQEVLRKLMEDMLAQEIRRREQEERRSAEEEERRRREQEERLRQRQRNILLGSVSVLLVAIVYQTNKYIPLKPDVICLPFKFNSSTVNPTLFLDKGDMMVRNYKDKDTTSQDEDDERFHRLKHLKGIMANVAPDTPESYSYSVGVNYIIIEDVLDNKLLFQVGLSHPDVIDDANSIGLHKKAWSVSAVGCESKHICLVAENDGKTLASKPISGNGRKTTVSLKLTIEVSVPFGSIRFSLMPLNLEVFGFTDVDLAVSPVPVFAVFNPKLSNISMTLLDEDNRITFNISTMHQSIFVSEDQRTIANFRSSDSFLGGTVRDKLSKYNGVLGDIFFTTKARQEDLPYFFETVATFDFYKDTLIGENFIFQVGFTHKDKIDQSVSLRSVPNNWAVELSKCPRSTFDICLVAWHNGSSLEKIELVKLSSLSRLNSALTVTFKLFPYERKIRVSIRRPRKRLVTFTNVDFSQPLLTVFGLNSNPRVSLELKTHADIDRFSFFGYSLKEPVCDL